MNKDEIKKLNCTSLRDIECDGLTSCITRDLDYEIKNAALEAAKDGRTQCFLNLENEYEMQYVMRYLKLDLNKDGIAIVDKGHYVHPEPIPTKVKTWYGTKTIYEEVQGYYEHRLLISWI